MTDKAKKKFKVDYLYKFSEKAKPYGLWGRHLAVEEDVLYLMQDKNGKVEIEKKHIVEGLWKFLKKQGRLKVTIGKLPNDDILIGLAGKDGYGYVWNLNCEWCSEWGSGADLVKE